MFENNKCSSDKPMAYALLPDQCMPDPDDGSSYSISCTNSGIQYAYYDSNEDCSASPDAAYFDKFAKCKKEGFFDDDYYYYDDGNDNDQPSLGDDDYYYYDDFFGGDAFTVSCCTYDQSVCEKSMDQDTGDDENVCFGAMEQVTTLAGEKAISEVSVGEAVLTMTAEGRFVFSEVVFVPHDANTKSAQFVQIMTTSSSLRATKGHLLPAGECGSETFDLRAIENVVVGQCVRTTAGEAPVIRSETAVGHGVYTLVTMEKNGHIVVNGIVASSFGVNHAVANAYYHFHRMVYNIAPTLMQTSWMTKMTAILGDLAVSLMM